MRKLVLGLLFAAACASAGIVTTTTGSCTVKDSSGNVIDSQSYPNNCVGLSWPAAQVIAPLLGGSLSIQLGGMISVIHPTSPIAGTTYYQEFESTLTIDDWLVVVGGSGSGLIKGISEGGVDSCCVGPADGAAASASVFANSIPIATSNIPFGSQNFTIPFQFGVPFHITGSLFIGSGGNPLLGPVEANASARVDGYGIYDTSGNLLTNAAIIEAAPEPSTWLLLICGAALVFATSPRPNRQMRHVH